MQTTGMIGMGLGGANPNSPDAYQGPSDNNEDLELRLTDSIRKAQFDAEKFTKNDQTIKRKDTVEVVMDILNRIKATAEEVNKLSQEMREKLYHVSFNATVLIFRLTRILREASFSKEATHFLAFNVLCLDNNLILTTAKYLDWRVMNYVELSRSYADLSAYKAATRVVSYGVQKVLYLKQIEEQDQPVPDGTKETLVESLRVLRTQELKYQLQSGALTADAWKKKIEETFTQNKYHRSLALVECLSNNDPLNCRMIQRSAKNMTVKSQALKMSLDLVKADIELLKQALIQIHEKKKRDREKKDALAALETQPDINVDEMLERYKVMDQEMIKEKDWKFAAYNVPIEVHVELLKMCFECRMWPEFDSLLDPALIRLKFRRYEVPYLATVDVLMSANRTANIPNGFEKIAKDLNAANLKIELKKLRQQAKLAGVSDKGAPKEEDKKKDDKKAPAQPPPAAKPDPKAAAAAGKGGKVDPKAAAQTQQQEIPKDEEDEQHVHASDVELERIKHVYVNLLLQRTKNAQNAIVGVDVVLADENMGPNLPDNHFAVAVPIRQHHGVYEKTKLIPYVVFRRTANGLIDEEDCLSIVTDVQIIMGQDAHLRAPLGYHKIPIDLRQTPKDLERVPNLDYVFICYKTDKQLAMTERDLLLFRRLAELEKSYIEKAHAVQQTDELKAFLGLNFNMEMLVDLARTVKEALLGPLGDFYLEHRQDILFDLACLLWSKYMLPILQKVDLYTEMRHQREYPYEFIQNMDEMIIQVKNNFAEAFNVMHRILTRMNFVEDMIMYSKFSIYLACFQEELGEFRNSVQTLRSALGKITEYREERLKQSLDSRENIRTSMSITIDNKKIGELESKIHAVYEAWEQMILRKERDRERKEDEGRPLEEDEGDEEQMEVQRCIEELKNKDLFEKGISFEEWRKTMKIKNQLSGTKYYNEQEQIVHSLHCDLLLNLYRCEIKLGKEMQVVKTQTNKLLQTQGIDLSKHAPGNLTKNLSSSLTQKMNQTKTNKTLAKAKGDLSTLKQTLQEAGKLPPPKPQIQTYEKLLEKENNNNSYQNALLQMCLAVAKTNIVEQKSLLLESIEYLKKAKAQEDHMSSLAVENAIYIKAAAHYHSYFNRSADQVHPFHLMAHQQYIKKSPVPSRPIFICRTSTSILMKLPFYKPITEYKSWRNIGEMSLYGKPSGSGVGVSLNNTEYDGTGERRPPGDIVRVTGLVPNEKYVFAAGGYTKDGICVNGIGETSTEIVALLPLSLHQLYGYLAEIAYKLGHYQIAKQAAETLCSQFIEKNELKYSFLDTRVNPILAFRLNTSYLSLISPIEAKQLAESFLILARVSKVVKSDTQKRADTHELKVEKQKIDMKISNYLLIALDIAGSISQPTLTKRLVSELFTHLVPYLEMKVRPQVLFQVLFKCHQAATKQVPQELIDSNMRRVIGCLTYQILRMGFEGGEEEVVKRVMLSELPANTRKWRKYTQYVVRKPELNEEQRLKKEDQERRITEGEFIADSDLIKDPEPYEEKLIKLDEFEQEGSSLEEYLLSLIDYQDIVKAKAERWKLQINRYQKSAGNEAVEKVKEELQQVVDFWEGVKVQNPAQQLQQLLTAFDPSNPNLKYLEFCCKCVRRSMELGLQSFAELEDLLASKIKLGGPQVDEQVAMVENKLTERLEYLEKDIVRKQRRRFNALEEKVQQLQEQKSLSGGNQVMNIEKLMESIKNDQSALVDLKEEDYFGLLPFDNEADEKQAVYNYLWISEKLLLQGMCMFLAFQASQPPRSQLTLVNTPQGTSCVFNDILQLDFSKTKQALDEHNDRQRQQMMSFYEDHKESSEAKFHAKVEDRVTKVTAFLKVMARAAEYAKQARAWLQLENVLRYTWNTFKYDLTTPIELKETEGWKYLVQMAEASLVLMEQLKNNGGRLRANQQRDIDEVKGQKPTLYGNGGKTVAFQMHSEDEEGGFKSLKKPDEQLGTSRSSAASTAGGSGNKGLKWFERIADQFEVSLHASFVAFAVQGLMGVKQWESLVDLSNRLNDVTLNHYASQLLPFIIFAQTTLYQEAAGQTYEKRNDLVGRIKAFETWKLTNKKKRSRQAMITGEIPQEEQEFLRDKAQLEKEIFRLEIIENVLNTDRLHSESVLDNVKRDANACEESLKQCRKLYFQYGVETQNLKLDENKKGTQHFEIKTKRKGHKVYSSMVISNYKKCVDLLRKRQEKFLLIQALHELGNLLYADGQLGEAEIQWNDCIDTIFQRLYVLSSFRQVFKDNPGALLADTFGSRQCLIGGVVLTKLGKLCYEGRDMHRFNECLLMAGELFAAPARLSLPHAQPAIEYGQYKLREFLNEQLFVDQYIITPSELLNTLSTTAQSLMDSDLHEKSLPLTSLMEYLASDIVRSKVLTTKARIMKALALTEIGYLNEAYQIYNRVLSLKDLPKQGGTRDSDFLQKKEGKNFYFPYQQRYHNNFPPEHEKNLEAIQNMLKPLTAEVLNQLNKFCSPYIVELLQYLRCSLLVRVGESENVEAPEKGDLRNQVLKVAEEGLRGGVLKNIQLNEEVGYLKDRLETLNQKLIDIPEVEIADLKAKLAKVYEQAGTPLEDQKTYYTNKEEELCYADRRSQFLSLMLRSRMLVARIQSKQGMLLTSFYVLRQALLNFKAFAEGKHMKVETGMESEEKGSFRLPEIYGGVGLLGAAAAIDPKAKGAPPAKAPPADPKKPAPGGKGAPVASAADDEELKKQEDERKKRELDEELKEKQRIELAERRDHPHIYLWLKIKLEIIAILFHQRRFDDCMDAIAVTRLECQGLNDLFFVRQLLEIEFMMEVYRGEIDSAARQAEKIKKHASAYHQNDLAYANFLGNLSEFLYNKEKQYNCVDHAKEGRAIVWLKLRDYGIDLEPQNVNFKGDVKVNKARVKPNEEVLAQFQSAPVAAAGGKGAPAQKGAPPAKPGAPAGKGQPAGAAVIDDLPTEEEKLEAPLDFTQKVDYPLIPSDPILNSSYLEPNIYLRYLESAIRFDVRYAQYLAMIAKPVTNQSKASYQYELAKKILGDSEKLLKRCLHVAPSMKFYVNYLLGQTNLKLFYEKVEEFQAKYSKDHKYKESLAKHIPYGSIALGHFMLELPNFSEQLKTQFKDYLEWAKKHFKLSVDIGRLECLSSEFDFTLLDALRSLSETSFLLSDYRQRTLAYKYAKYRDLDMARKLANKVQQKKENDNVNISGDDNLALQEEIKNAKDDWEESKLQKERVEVANAKRWAVYYMDACVQGSRAMREFIDKQHILAQSALVDNAAKLPKEVASEMFENSQVTKVNYAKIPDFEPKDKTVITPAEVLSYLKALAKELEFMTFGEEKQRQTKLISKLHRYLKVNLPTTYGAKCSMDATILAKVEGPEEFKDAASVNVADGNIEGFLQRGKVLGRWFDFRGQKSSFFYIIGPADEGVLNALLPPPSSEHNLADDDVKIREELRKDNTIIHMGSVEVDPLVLSALYQEVRDLADKMKASEKNGSATQNERDRKGYRVKFNQLIERLGLLFKAPATGDEELDNPDALLGAETVMDLFTNDGSTLLPDLTVENVEKLAQMLQKDSGCLLVDPKFNTILRRFHRLRYSK